MTERTPRDLKDRDSETRKMKWKPTSLLPEPPADANYVYRWVRVSARGEADYRNVSAKFREGWVPVPKEEMPDMKVMSDLNTKFKDNIEVGGLILCRAPREFKEAREEYHRQMARQQLQGVDNDLMRINDPRMPVFAQRRTKISNSTE